MKEKLNMVLLVDDDPATNAFNEFVISKAECADHVEVCESAIDALIFLRTKVNGKYPQPAVIFLDINMPDMDGWEFLDRYEKLETEQQAEVLVVMLTTSVDSEDLETAKRRGVGGFVGKPLSVEVIHSLIEERLPRYWMEDDSKDEI